VNVVRALVSVHHFKIDEMSRDGDHAWTARLPETWAPEG
jgi:hypothetical protein